MAIGLTLGGFFIGLIIMAGSNELFGALGGAALGFLAARLITLERRLRDLGADHEWLRRQVSGDETSPATPQPEDATRTQADPPPSRVPEPVAGDQPATPTAATEPSAFEPEPTQSPAPAGKRPSMVASASGRVAAWFTTGNVPVKVGVLLSFIGVSFFLKYAIDNELLSVPIEFRLLGVAAGALVMIVIGWRLRHRLRVYAISLQGGGLGILFLTIFAAFRIWELMPAGLAFALLVALAGFTGALSVLQKARALIVLGAIGGFLAPVLTSTGQGSHVALFSYYLVLNATILGVSWFHAWRAVNLVGFVFTFVIGSFWGYRYYRPELFASTEPFLVAHFLLYQAIAILFALRQPPSKVGLVDGALVFGTPVIAFALQAALVDNFEYGLAISAAVLAVFYALTAAWLQRSHGAALRVLIESFIALAVAFATITIPLALDARWTSAAWALEGAALIWIATRQGRHLPNLAGVGLIVFSGLAFLVHGWKHDAGWPALNANVLGGAMIAFSALFGARKLEHFTLQPIGRAYKWMAWALFGWGVMWLLATGVKEIEDRLPQAQEVHVWLLFISAIAASFAWMGKARDWKMARWLTLLYLPALIWTALYYLDYRWHFLFGLGWLAWPVALAVQARLLYLMDSRSHRLAAAWHVITGGLLALVPAFEANWQVDMALSGDWGVAVASTMPGILALLIWRFRHQPGWPVPEHPIAYRILSLALVGGQALFLVAASIAEPGDPGSMPYVPVFNPFDLAMLFAALTALISLVIVRRDREMLEDSNLPPWLTPYKAFLAAAFLVLTTTALLRGVHHFAGVPWDFDRLYDSVIAQTALSIYWGLIGFSGMIWGARRAQRWVWLAGAGFMALVVLKLFVVDLGNSGTIERIISFIGVGVLLLVVGYFAPVPPRQAEDLE